MAKQKFQKGEKVKINCTDEQLKLVRIFDVKPGQEVFIIKKDFQTDGKIFYEINENPKSKMQNYIIEEKYLTKIK